MIQIDIESSEVETRNKRAGGTYQVQKGFAHTFDKNGEPKRYPEEVAFFVPKDNSGNAVPYKPGKYKLAPQVLRVNNGFLDLGFPVLEPLK